MRFWTSMQLPICQAAFVEGGKIVQTIPTNSPQTPARQITQVGEWDGKLMIGRRFSIELWDPAAPQQLRSVYHKYMYGMHCLKRWRDKILVCSGQIDVIFLIDWDGKIHWEWWAHKHGLTSRCEALDRPDWPVVQTSFGLVDKPDSTGMNSVHPLNDEEILVTFHRLRKVGRINISGKMTLLGGVPDIPALHDYQFDPDDGSTIYGHNDGIRTCKKDVPGYTFVRRIRCLGNGEYLFAHNEGMTIINQVGKKLEHAPVPRPFDIALLER